jgi:Neuraminidase (sialidase)
VTRNRRGRRLALLAATLIIVAQGAASAATTGTPRLTAPVNATKDDLNPGRLYLAPSLAVDPNNQLRVAAGMTEARTKTCFLMRSTNGGQTWTRPQASPAPNSYPFCNTNNRGSYEAQTAFGRDGNLYMSFPGWDTQDAGTRGDVSLIVSRSSDFGNSWQPVVAVDNRGKTGLDAQSIRPVGSIAVDAKSGSDDIVYVSYASTQTNASAPNAAPNLPTVIVSTDGGRHFGAPVNLAPTAFNNPATRQAALTSRTTIPGTTTTTAPAGSLAAQPDQLANFGGFQPVVSVANDGTVYAVWPAATSRNVSPGIPTGIFLSKSTDHGKTWTTTQAGSFSYNNGSFIQMAWSPGGGPQGTVHIVYPGTPRPEVNGYSDIEYVRSTDGGKTFSAPKNITDDDPAQLAGQYYPNVQVSPNGKRVDVVWYDTRNDPGYRSNDVYYAYSTDDGQNWSKNLRVTDQPIDRRFGVWALNYDVTTPPSLASANAYTIFGWDDTRNSDKTVTDNNSLGGGLQDFFTADAQYATIGGGTSKAAKIVAAGVVGLLAVGLILLLVAFIARGRSGAPPAPTKKAAAAKAGAAP